MRRWRKVSLTLATTLMVGAPAVTAAAPASAAATVNCAKVKCIALTFDDGPSAYTPKLLDTLRKNKAKVTFFLVGQQVKKYPNTVRRMSREGHEIGSHTYTHPHLIELDGSAILNEITDAQDAIKKVTGKRPKLMRPPYGQVNGDVRAVAEFVGLPLVNWTDSSRDWELRKAKAIEKKVLGFAKRDGVVLMHDSVKGTVDAMPRILKTLKKRGYHVVPVSAVLRGKLPAPGKLFHYGRID